MPFCEQCGTRLAEGTSTCASCGRAQPEAAPAAPPPPPPGYSLDTPAGAPPRAPEPGPVPGSHHPSPPAALAPSFPGPLVPPLAAAIAVVVTVAYAAAYTLIDWGELPSLGTFLTGATPVAFGSPFTGYYSLAEWFDIAPFGGGLALAIPLLALILSTALLSSLTNTSAGGRLAIGALVFVPTVALTIFSALLNYAIASAEYYYYESLGEVIARGAGGAAVLGLIGGLLGALLSMAIRRPRKAVGTPVAYAQPW